jgi:hypothetical protein
MASVVNYDRNSSIIVLATVITIVNYDCNSFIIQATGHTAHFIAQLNQTKSGKLFHQLAISSITHFINMSC